MNLAEYVTDAHALLWHLCAPNRLGRAARAAFAEADRGAARIHVPTVVIAEALMVVQKGRLPGVALSELLFHLEGMQPSDNYLLRPLLPQTVLDSHRWSSIPDIFDRLIVAESLELGMSLLSCDPVIRDSGLVKMIWD